MNENTMVIRSIKRDSAIYGSIDDIQRWLLNIALDYNKKEVKTIIIFVTEQLNKLKHD